MQRKAWRWEDSTFDLDFHTELLDLLNALLRKAETGLRSWRQKTPTRSALRRWSSSRWKRRCHAFMRHESWDTLKDPTTWRDSRRQTSP